MELKPAKGSARPDPPPCEGCGGACARGLCEEAAAVAVNWMLEYMSCCLCRQFQEERAQAFQHSRNALEALLQGIPKLDQEQMRTVHLCQFLSRIADGKNLDSQFEEDDNITPLEAALMVWQSMRKEQEHIASLHEEIHLLVQIQAVAVCMEQGNYKQSTDVLGRLFVGEDSNKPIRMKLAMIINKKDPYHPFLQSFSYNQMLKKIYSFIDVILNERPPNFLVKAATKVVEAKRAAAPQLEVNKSENEMENEINCEKNIRCSTNLISASKTNEDTSLNETKDANANETKPTSSKSRKRAHTVHNIVEDANGPTQLQKKDDKLRAHKRLFSVTLHKPWTPEPQSSLKRLAANRRISNYRSISSLAKRNKHASPSSENATIRKKRLWMPDEDGQLLKGVQEFGVGNWRQILLHYKFKNRTGVMLKDRWRTMKKLNIVGSQSEMY